MLVSVSLALSLALLSRPDLSAAQVDISNEAYQKVLKPFPGELDTKSPRFLRKEIPQFLIQRPVASKSKTRFSVDGSKWGFVDLEMRRKRFETRWEILTAQREKLMADENTPEEDQEQARKELLRIKALRRQQMEDLDKIGCVLELVGNPDVRMEIRTEDRPRELGFKQIEKQLRIQLEGENHKIIKEQNETARGTRTPGYTFVTEQTVESSEGTQTIWARKTVYMVAKPKRAGHALIYFDCQAPAPVKKELEMAFELFIRSTKF